MATSSLSGLGLSGLSSGLDTSSIITKLMAIEAAPQTVLKSRLTTATTTRTALQSLNTAVAALATAAKATAKPGALASFSATSSTTAVTATASSSASAGSVSFTVDHLATAQVSVTDAMSTWPDSSSATPSITIRTGTGGSATTKTVVAASTSLDDVVAAVNGSGSGVTAQKVAAGRDPGSGATIYRLQLRGATGDGNGFSVFEGADTSAPALPTTEVSTAASAQLTLYKGVAGAEQQVTSDSNTFDELLTGVDVTVSAVSTTAAEVTVAAVPTAATTAAQTLTSSLTTLFSGIASASSVTTTTGTDGTPKTTGGVFTGDGSIRALNDALLAASSAPVDGRSPSTIGIVLTKDGSITFDQARFSAAMAADPSGTSAMLQTVADRVASAASAASDPYTGTLTSRITSAQGTETSLTKDIADWDTRLAVIQAQYTAQFNALETALNSLNSQASYLTSQISGLTTNYQSTK